MTSHVAQRRLTCLALLLATSLACSDDAHPGADSQLTDRDSTVMLREYRASISGGASRGDSYAYRGLSAGVARSVLEAQLGARRDTAASGCSTSAPSPKAPAVTTCTYATVLGGDSASVKVEALYARSGSMEFARTITVTRDLPLDVDGVSLARMLADEFERQTSFLDSRDATFGHHTAHLRIGATRNSQQNFVEIDLAPVASREVLTVRLNRSTPASTSRTAPSHD